MGRKRKIVRKSPEVRKSEILALLTRKPSTTSDIAKAMTMHTSSVGTFLNEMAEDGVITYAGEGGRGDPYIFSVSGKSNGSKKSNGTAMVKAAATPTVVETMRITADQLPKDEVVFGACALAIRKAEKRGEVTLTRDSPVMDLLNFAVEAHIAQGT